jgi:hypothetical protein
MQRKLVARIYTNHVGNRGSISGALPQLEGESASQLIREDMRLAKALGCSLKSARIVRQPH